MERISFQECDGLQVWMAALYRFHQHRSQFVGVGANPFHDSDVPYIQHGDVGDFFLGIPGATGVDCGTPAFL